MLGPTMLVMTTSQAPSEATPPMLDEQDRVAILQLLTLSPSQRLQYMLDELDFDAATSSGA